MKNIVVVGAGFSGVVIARQLAEVLNEKVLLVEKRPHVAGNMYDEKDEHGILLHKYGPHVLVTNYWSIIKYLSRFSPLYQYTVKEISLIDGKYIRLPFNFESVQQLIGGEKAEILINKLRKEFYGQARVPVLKLATHPDKDISSFGNLLFEKAYRTYCAKQWDVPVETLDKTIMERVPMAMSYDERYMDKDFQYLPVAGYRVLFEQMLKHPNITVRLNEDALDHLQFKEDKSILYDGKKVDCLVYTGALDELFNLKYGELPYRSLRITYEWYDKERVFPQEIVSCPQAEGYTRKTEYRYMMQNSSECHGTTIATEYPTAYIKKSGLTPFYPVITEETKTKHQLYCQEATSYKCIFLCGRLAEFRYYNMDDCILHAFNVFEKIKTYLQNKQEAL